ncbi:MAG: lipopolysaccharide biosynthesis protein [Dysgonomonas sp.]|nr:lipopolysaccharide biosynthesis protein [Dysgonomonas sp.]
MEEKSLKDKTFSGLSWSFLDKIFQNGFVLVAGILLARMINKDEFGLIGALAIFTAVANILHESGFSTALIRKKEVTPSDYTTVFCINVSIGVFLYLLLFFLAPLISNFNENEIFTPLSRFLFLSFLFNSFAVIQNAKLIKEINYKLITKINATAIFVSYSVALILALFGFGVWALASQVVLWTFLKMCGLWIFSKWRPSGSFSMESFKDLFSFSSKLLLGSLLNAVMANLPQSLIAKIYSWDVGGLYNQASKNYNSANDLLNGSVYNVSFPILSTIHDEVKLKSAFRKFIRIKALIIFPMFMGMALVARPFIYLLGEQWNDAVPILQLLCFGGLFAGLETANGDILRIKGKSGKILALTIFQGIFILCAIAIPYFFNLHYLFYIGGLSFSYFIRYVVSCMISNKLIGYKIFELVKDLFPYFVISLLCIVCGYLLKYLIFNSIILLISQVVFVGILYIGIVYYSGSKILNEAVEYIKKKPVR